MQHFTQYVIHDLQINLYFAEPAQPTDQCPNQFGYFKLGDQRNCSYFRNCVNGVGYDFQCPDGLAWSSQTYRCEWPDEVEDCDAEGIKNFSLLQLE